MIQSSKFGIGLVSGCHTGFVTASSRRARLGVACPCVHDIVARRRRIMTRARSYTQMMLIAHLSDLHLTAGTLAALPVQHGYDALIRVQAFDPRPDCLLITGDLVERGEPAEYEQARKLLDILDIPVHVVPGNHDHAPRMLAALAGTGYVRPAPGEPERCYYRIDYPGLRLFCLDSSVPGRHDGELGLAQLAWLDSELARDSDVPAIVAMHHHPLRSGIQVMDQVQLSDADALAGVLGNHPPVARILIGHLHRVMATSFAGSLLMAAPSTYQQVYLDLSTRRIDAFVQEPASMLLHWADGDQVVSHVVPIHSGPPVGKIGRSSPR